jgi:hypothetical protein
MRLIPPIKELIIMRKCLEKKFAEDKNNKPQEK